jgi:hypothetical protein
MRSRRLVPALAVALLLGACGSATAARTATPSTRAAARAATDAADPALLLRTSDGTVSVRTSTGAVAFRAPNGIAAPDRSVIVQAEPVATGTRVVASDALTGVPRWQHDIPGARHVRVVSPGGRYVALVDAALTTASEARDSTVVDVVTARGAHAYRFTGDLDPEAFSVDGQWLYVLDFHPDRPGGEYGAATAYRYSVRRVELATGRTEAVPDQDGSVRAPMPGYAQSQVMSPDGTRLYTFYASAEPIKGDDGDEYHAWIHVLDLAHGWAHCLELDEKIAEGGAANAALALNAGGSRLYVSDRLSGALVAIDTATLHTVETRFTDGLPSLTTQALLATAGPTLFVNAPRGLVRVDAATLEAAPGVIVPNEEVTSMRADHEGRALFLVATDGLFVLDRQGRQVARWGLPGDATELAPATMPGRGSYRCAC